MSNPRASTPSFRVQSLPINTSQYFPHAPSSAFVNTQQPTQDLNPQAAFFNHFLSTSNTPPNQPAPQESVQVKEESNASYSFSINNGEATAPIHAVDNQQDLIHLRNQVNQLEQRLERNVSMLRELEAKIAMQNSIYGTILQQLISISNRQNQIWQQQQQQQTNNQQIYQQQQSSNVIPKCYIWISFSWFSLHSWRYSIIVISVISHLQRILSIIFPIIKVNIQ